LPRIMSTGFTSLFYSMRVGYAARGPVRPN